MADALEVVAGGLRAGLPPAAALSVAGDATVWGRVETVRVRQVGSRLEEGVPTGSAWLSPLDSDAAADGYRAVGSVWDLALQTGGPLAEAVQHLSEHLREEARLRGRLEALAAGPRASARLLTMLPLAGPLLALLIGADPADVYLSSAATALSVAVGLLLTVVGWRWTARMVGDAARPRRYGALSTRGRDEG